MNDFGRWLQLAIDALGTDDLDPAALIEDDTVHIWGGARFHVWMVTAPRGLDLPVPLLWDESDWSNNHMRALQALCGDMAGMTDAAKLTIAPYSAEWLANASKIPGVSYWRIADASPLVNFDAVLKLPWAVSLQAMATCVRPEVTR